MQRFNIWSLTEVMIYKDVFISVVRTLASQAEGRG